MRNAATFWAVFLCLSAATSGRPVWIDAEKIVQVNAGGDGWCPVGSTTLEKDNALRQCVKESVPTVILGITNAKTHGHALD